MDGGKYFVRNSQIRYASTITIVCFIALIIDRYSDGLLPPIRQFSLFQIEILSSWISQRNILPPALNYFRCIYLISGDLWLFGFSIANSNSETLGSLTRGLGVCISVCLTLLTPCKLNGWEKEFLQLAKILWDPTIKSSSSFFTLLFLCW